jgi:hypothetical protein
MPTDHDVWLAWQRDRDGDPAALRAILVDPRRAAALVEDIRFDYGLRETLRVRAAAPRRRRRWVVVIGGALAAGLALAALLPVLASGPGPAAWRLVEGVVVGDGAPAPGDPVASAAEWTVPATAGARLVRNDGSMAELAGGSVVRVRPDGVDLVAGRVRSTVMPIADGRPFTVAAGPAEVRVLGTAFSVAAADGFASVDVERGRVAVRRPGDGAAVELAAGGAAVVRPAGPLVDTGAGPGPGWDDRRPIAILRLWGGTRPGINPRRYESAPENADLTTPAGRTAFAAALATDGARWADALVAAGAQGAVVWDLEGWHPEIMYAGAPDRLPDLSPEMAVAAPGLFRALAARGLRTGVLLRPERLERSGNGWRQVATADHAAILAAKAAHAHAAWGSTLFFINSATLPGRRLAADAAAAVRAAVPDARIIVEDPGPGDGAVAAGWIPAPAPALDPEQRRRRPGLIRAVYQPRDGGPGGFDPATDVLVREFADLVR